MLQTETISQLFLKLHDLKKIFNYGEKLIPIIHSLGEFMKDTVPLLQSINQSIADSTSKIPKATNQIHNVTSATELATTEILDLVDILNQDLDSIKNAVAESIEKETDKEDFLNSLVPSLNKTDAQVIVNEFLKKNSSTSILTNLLQLINKMKSDANSITVSLQVQDITAQQLASVNHLIESVQERLALLIEDFDNTNISDLKSSDLDMSDGETFDSNARYTKSSVPQQTVDSILNKEMQTASQDEIDKLFN
jgi:chemotaxis regulatin CheY-phosphate phosphatase CheZ